MLQYMSVAYTEMYNKLTRRFLLPKLTSLLFIYITSCVRVLYKWQKCVSQFSFGVHPELFNILLNIRNKVRIYRYGSLFTLNFVYL